MSAGDWTRPDGPSNECLVQDGKPSRKEKPPKSVRFDFASIQMYSDEEGISLEWQRGDEYQCESDPGEMDDDAELHEWTRQSRRESVQPESGGGKNEDGLVENSRDMSCDLEWAKCYPELQSKQVEVEQTIKELMELELGDVVRPFLQCYAELENAKLVKEQYRNRPTPLPLLQRSPAKQVIKDEQAHKGPTSNQTKKLYSDGLQLDATTNHANPLAMAGYRDHTWSINPDNELNVPQRPLPLLCPWDRTYQNSDPRSLNISDFSILEKLFSRYLSAKQSSLTHPRITALFQEPSYCKLCNNIKLSSLGQFMNHVTSRWHFDNVTKGGREFAFDDLQFWTSAIMGSPWGRMPGTRPPPRTA